MMTVNDRELIRELYDKYNKGERIKSEVLTDLYNKVLNRHEHNTNCGTCLRSRLFDLVNALNNTIKKYSKKLSEEDKEFLNWAKQLPTDHYPSFEKVVAIYNKAFDQHREETNCLPCLKGMLNDLYELL